MQRDWNFGSRHRDLGQGGSTTLSRAPPLATARIAVAASERSTVELKLNAVGRRRVAQAQWTRLITRYRASSSAGYALGLRSLISARRATH